MRQFNRRQLKETQEEALEAIAAREQKVFSYETLAAATRNFSLKNKIGEGGFGPVYKGKLDDGRLIAVKKLGSMSQQGAREFANEAILLSRLQHKNIVNLYGYCIHADDRILVYEYVPNKSLDKFIFSKVEGQKVDAEVFDWRRRYEVMVGIARGLLYLHEDAPITIIHRDIKANNILLDERWCPKITDFGIARLFPENLTHVNTRVAGTNGYMAPEYFMHGSLSTKADIFSFGVLILELVSGQKNSSFVPSPGAASLIEWALMLHKKKQTMDMVDPALRTTADPEQVAMCVHLGVLCTQADSKQRPDISRVSVILSKKPGIDSPLRLGIPASRHRRRPHGLHGSPYMTGESSTTIPVPFASDSASTIASASNTVSTNSSASSAITIITMATARSVKAHTF